MSATPNVQANTQGKIVQCIGAVIDIQFAGEHFPTVYDAL
jgi:F-type H+-transporting ATPase subunit beta